MRAAHFGLKKINAQVCQKCGESVLSHHACAKCGAYNGRQVLSTDKQTDRLLKKKTAKAQVAPTPQKEDGPQKPAKKDADKKKKTPKV